MPEKRTAPERRNGLSSQQSWESLFQQDIPETEKRVSTRSIALGLRDSLANIHLVFAIPVAHDKWREFKSTYISAENTSSISFTPGTIPYFLIDESLFRHPAHHTESIEILDLSMVKELEGKLKEKRVLRTNGSLAGEILFVYNNRYASDKRVAAIGFGVVNSDTNEPEGIIFCPEGMFPYKKTDFSGKRKQKRQIAQIVKQPVLQPLGIPI